LVKKKKLNGGLLPKCIGCEIEVIVNVDQTCGNPECKLKAHKMFHQIIQNTQQEKGCEVFV